MRTKSTAFARFLDAHLDHYTHRTKAAKLSYRCEIAGQLRDARGYWWQMHRQSDADRMHHYRGIVRCASVIRQIQAEASRS